MVSLDSDASSPDNGENNDDELSIFSAITDLHGEGEVDSYEREEELEEGWAEELDDWEGELHSDYGLVDYVLGYEGGVTIEGFQDKIKDIPADVVQKTIVKYNLLHHYVGSNVYEITLEMVEFLLQLAPTAVSKIDDAPLFPAHAHGKGAMTLNIASFNADCPAPVIKLLLEKNPSAIKHSWNEGYGLPLHCYVARSLNHEAWGSYDEDDNWIEETPSFPTGELDYGVLTMLIEAYPEALISGKRSPMHILCEGYGVTLELAKLLTDKDHACLKMVTKGSLFDDDDDDPNDFPIRCLLSNRYADPFPTDVFRYLLENNRSSLKMVKRKKKTCPDLDYSDDFGGIVDDVGDDNDDDDDDWCTITRTETPLNAACSNPKMTADVIQLIINSCPEMVTTEYKYDGCLPLHTLCQNTDLGEQSSLDIAKLLVRAHPESVKSRVGEGIMHGICDDEGKLPIHIAEEHKSLEFCKILLSERARLSSVRGVNLLQAAFVCKCSLETVKKLVEEDRELLQMKDEHGHIALHTASSCGSLEVVRYLVEGNEFNLTVSDKKGSLPLHKACWFGELENVEYLMAKNMMTITARNNRNELPIHALSSRSGKREKTLRSVKYGETIFKLLRAYPETVV